ncbi:MAG: hypothetical protein IJZ39_09760 [Oscillospiraceae bacterium]|nr:hypothetical protein [Oscillospiraceae bacterium]
MDYLNEQIRLLQQKVSRKKHLHARVCNLRGQRSALQYKIAALQTSAMKEEADVVRLEGRSLASFYYNVIGKMDEKLDQERREAYAARVKCDAAVRELDAIERDLAQCSTELNALDLCEEHYRLCLEEKAAAIKASGFPDGLQILRLETLIQLRECHMKELNEALDAGKAALFTAMQIQSSLESAEALGTWDMFGGGMLTDLAKHEHLDTAQTMVEKLQIQLRRFQSELTDVSIDADLQISVEGFTCFADFFFDGLFADWAVMDRIGQTRSRLRRTSDLISRVIRQLEEQTGATASEMENDRHNLNTLIINA